MKIVLKAKQNFANSLTQGKIYPAVCQSRTGFLVIDDGNFQVDLYIHFFEIGIETNGKIEWMPQRDASNVKVADQEVPEEVLTESESQEESFEEVAVEEDVPETIAEPEDLPKDMLYNEEDDF